MVRLCYNHIFANNDEVTDMDTAAFSQGSIFNDSWLDFNSDNNLEVSDDSATVYFDALSDVDLPLPLNCDSTRNKWNTPVISEMKNLFYNTSFQNRKENKNETIKSNGHDTAYIAMNEKVQENIIREIYRPFEIFTDLDDPDQDYSDLDDLDEADYEIR